MRRWAYKVVVRCKPVKTTISYKANPCPLDKVNRQFRAEWPDALWVSNFTYVITWQGLVYMAFVIDVFARIIVGCAFPVQPAQTLCSMRWNRRCMPPTGRPGQPKSLFTTSDIEKRVRREYVKKMRSRL